MISAQSDRLPYPGFQDLADLFKLNDFVIQGMGIVPDTVGEIFAPFYCTNPQGTGLGL